MVVQVCSIRDAVHKEYQGISLELSTASAIRNFVSSVETSYAAGSGLLFTHTSDFSLWKLGEFDSESGVFTPCQPERLIEGSEINV